MPKKELAAPMSVPYTDEMLGISDEMIDEDKDYSIISNFDAGASLSDGISGLKAIDTLYENTSEETIEKPRNSQAPIQTNRGEYPHRSY